MWAEVNVSAINRQQIILGLIGSVTVNLRAIPREAPMEPAVPPMLILEMMARETTNGSESGVPGEIPHH